MVLQANKLRKIIILLLPLFFYIAVKFLMRIDVETICIWKILTHHDCFGCGITRAFNAIFSGHFKDAYNYNPRIVVVAPLMLILWLSLLLPERLKINH